MRKRYAALDYLRAVSAILVVLYHYTTRYGELYNAQQLFPLNFSFGFMAICSFFVLSGFLINEGLDYEKSACRFTYMRAVRLYPTYWVCIILTSVITFFFLPDKFLPFKSIAINLTMLEGFLGSPYVDGVYWTLRIEVLFYVLIASIILLNLRKFTKHICLAVITCALISNIVSSENVIIKLIRYFLSPDYIQMFIAGMVISMLFSKKHQKPLDIVVLLTTMSLCITNQLICLSPGYFIFFAAVILFIIVTVKWLPDYDKPKTVLGVALQWIASISYPLYLIHQYFGYAIINQLRRIGLTSEFLILIPIAASICVAYLIHRLIEVPSSKFLKKIDIGIKSKN